MNTKGSDAGIDVALFGSRFVSEIWDVYTRGRKLTGKTCLRGEQHNLINELIKNPEIRQKDLAIAIGKSERTVKTRTVEMQEKGLICRENGKRNGRRKVLIEL